MKTNHGGARKGAGRKPSPDRLIRVDARLSKSQIEYLKNIDPNVSKALRTVTDQQRSKMDHPTDEQIARNYELWQQYADPHGTMTRAEFDALTMNEKIEMLREMFPQD